jgi:RNA polymerase sigma-70 factor (ECF subfamily)
MTERQAEALIDAMFRKLWRLARWRAKELGVCDGDVDDIAQQALVDVWRFLRSSQDEPTSIEALTVTIATRRVADWRRRPDQKMSFDSPLALDSAPSSAKTAEQCCMTEEMTEERDQRLLAALEKLSPQQRQVIQLRLRGKTLDKVAEFLGISPGAVRSHYFRALKRLFGELGE